ncbi:hypothetical protein GCM10022276_22870 [Sphingomonas limnosediminicola]|uniref:DUF6894 domain-containing protein n=1 Tax=Sphingomonas limnosediminicola TaxID=940133 RepID=A0ABP7LKE3_9SPHN
MPLYFFHLRDGEDTLIDGEGLELDDIEAAKATALLQARGIVSHDALEGFINLAQRVDVLDETGATVCSVAFEDAVRVSR